MFNHILATPSSRNQHTTRKVKNWSNKALNLTGLPLIPSPKNKMVMRQNVSMLLRLLHLQNIFYVLAIEYIFLC